MRLTLPRSLSLCALTLVVCVVAAAALGKPRAKRVVAAPPLVGAPFTLDAGRILLDVNFEAPGGGARKALVWFNMGMPAPVLTKPLYRELQLDHGQPLKFTLAGVDFNIASALVANGDGGLAVPTFSHLFAPRHVEAMLPASALRDYVVTLDYAHRRFALERPGQTPPGVAVPISLNAETGLASVDVGVDGRPYPFVIDAGSGYSWMRGETLRQWLASHPEWRRAEGAAGVANNNMLDYAFESRGTLARQPRLYNGDVVLKDVGVLGTGPALGNFVDSIVGDVFWDNWQKSAAGPVVGWLGANVLKQFKLSIDYPGRMSYWESQSAPDAHDLDTVGVTLVRREGRYYIAGIVKPAQGAAIEGVEVGDELFAVDSLAARSAGKSELFAALAGKPGETKLLTVVHANATTKIEARVLDLR
jgi:hypothetical protein